MVRPMHAAHAHRPAPEDQEQEGGAAVRGKIGGATTG